MQSFLMILVILRKDCEVMIRYVVEKSAVAENIARIRRQAGSAAVYAVVKADGYGLGCARLASLCAENGITRFAVTADEEAQTIVRAGISWEEILMLTPVEDARRIETLCRMGVTFTVSCSDDARALSRLWYLTGQRPRAHIKIDTGMGRRGFSPQRPEAIRALYTRFPEIVFTGIYSHLCCGCDTRQAKRQYARFSKVLAAITEAGIDPGIRHLSASAGLFHHPELNLDAVRVGSALLGRIPEAARFGLRPTGRCYVPVEQVRELPRGATVGYGAGYKTHRPVLAATCPIGARNGFGLVRRAGRLSLRKRVRSLLRTLMTRLTGRGTLYATVHGTACPVLGTVGTETVVLDVSRAACKRGDEAVFDVNPLLLSHARVEFL